MEKRTSIKVFEDKSIRTLWDEAQEKWYVSVIDVIEVLTGSPRPRKYWNALKTKLKAEGSELSHKLGQLKMAAEDGIVTALNAKTVLLLKNNNEKKN